MNKAPGYILVTGGAGFIGSHLVARLLDAGAHVTILDVAPPGSGSLLALKGLESRVSYRVGDVRRPDDLNFIRRGSFDVVFHLAAQPISSLSNAEPDATIAVNATGTRNVCAALRDAGRGSLVLASSACAYGRPDEGASPLREDDAVRPGVYRYSESKQRAEAALHEGAVHGIIGRFVNVYGPGDRHFSRIVPRTIRSLLRGEPLRLSRGNGSTVLDFLHVDDAVNGLLALAERVVSAESRGSDAELFNFGIGTGHALTIRHLVNTIAESFDGKRRELEIPDRCSEPVMVKYLDATKARRLLGWNPGIRLQQGLPATIAWYGSYVDRIEHLEDEAVPAPSVEEATA